MTTAQRVRQASGKVPPLIDTHPEVAEKVGREILESRLDPAAWAAALSATSGNRKQAISCYARIRMESLAGHHRVHLAKVDSFESRRMTKCLGNPDQQVEITRTVRQLAADPHLGIELIFPKPPLSPLWLAILWVGSAGTVATIGKLISAFLPDAIVNSLTTVSALAGLVVVGGAILLRHTLPKHWLLKGWNTGMLVACNLFCLSSLVFGTKVIMQSLAVESGVSQTQQSSPQPPSAKPAKPLAVKTVIIKSPYMVSSGVKTTRLAN